MACNFRCPYYQIESVTHHSKHSDIVLQADPRYATTAAFPKMVDFLKSELGTILDCKCENPSDLPFDQEVRNTELGHLYEHVILEYLCDEKIKNGAGSASFKGDTFWEVKEEQPYKFLIRIQLDITESSLLSKALDKANFLMEKLFVSHASDR